MSVLFYFIIIFFFFFFFLLLLFFSPDILALVAILFSGVERFSNIGKWTPKKHFCNLFYFIYLFIIIIFFFFFFFEISPLAQKMLFKGFLCVFF